MQFRWISSGTFLLLLVSGVLHGARAESPERAVCRTCELRGAQHGEEKVAAVRSYQGRDYHFCAKSCAEAFDAFPDAYAVHPIPRPAPRAVVTTMDGQDLVLGEPTNDVVLIDFWATWCAPCKKAMPKLEELHDEYGERGLSIVGVSIDEREKAVEKFLKKKDFSYTLARDTKPSPAWHAYFVAAIPAMVLLNREGSIVGEWRGVIDFEDVRERIERALAPDEGRREH